jgi:hypothetical protein
MKTTRIALLAALSIITFATDAFASDETTDLEEADEVAEEEDVEELEGEEFCGGEASPLDEADQLLGDRDWMGLYRETSHVLRTGRADWQRAQALSYLATAQLHMGRIRPAARNFALAFRLDPEQVGMSLRVEQAITQYRNGQIAEAHETAKAFAEEHCVAPQAWLVSSCWAARTVMAETADEGLLRATQRELAAAILPEDEARLEEVADFRALIGDVAAPRIASR